jgi:phosphoglycolate phosphatase-like HAD superfamily hydrolase
MTGVIVDLDGALGDTVPLWRDWLEETARVLGVDPAEVPSDRGDAAAFLDANGAGNWRTLLERYAEDRAPVYLRPAAEVGAALRQLATEGVRVVVVTDAPAELAAVAASQLGVTRRAEAVETGAGALERARARLGADAQEIATRSALVLRASG